MVQIQHFNGTFFLPLGVFFLCRSIFNDDGNRCRRLPDGGKCSTSNLALQFVECGIGGPFHASPTFRIIVGHGIVDRSIDRFIVLAVMRCGYPCQEKSNELDTGPFRVLIGTGKLASQFCCGTSTAAQEAFTRTCFYNLFGALDRWR